MSFVRRGDDNNAEELQDGNKSDTGAEKQDR